MKTLGFEGYCRCTVACKKGLLVQKPTISNFGFFLRLLGASESSLLFSFAKRTLNKGDNVFGLLLAV